MGSLAVSDLFAPSSLSLDVDSAVRNRYSAGAKTQVPELCCPVSYDPKYLQAIPAEVLERDYGCGDPSKHVQAGETVLDLGSGAGKICFIAAQVVGPEGRVIGVDVNPDMLAVARRNQPKVAEAIGFNNVTFCRGTIQDLQLDLDRLEKHLAVQPVASANGYLDLEIKIQALRESAPMIVTESMDTVVSNCVLNLVHPNAKAQMFAEIFRVLKHNGRAVISDIVSDEDVPLRMQNDPELWSGCISGALREDRFLQAFAAAGFHGNRILERGTTPWATVEGIEFRAMTVEAFKGEQGSCIEKNQAVIYTGPWQSVTDDDGHTLVRGQRMAVCDKTYERYRRAPYLDAILPVPPREEITDEQADRYDYKRKDRRDPRETKGQHNDTTTRGKPGGACC